MLGICMSLPHHMAPCWPSCVYKVTCLQVTSAERKLRAALLLDGLKPQDGYKLARYNDPFTLPFLRRNEIIMAVDGFNF